MTVGAGTQRVEDVLTKLFPAARVRRVDSDTMQSASRYRKLIDDFEARRVDVVVGTQMIAKGLDFPFVSFVGVLNADMALAAPDFRAGERLFQLITQVAGRAGRADLPGEVVVQALAVDTPALQAAMRHDFDRFAEVELKIRRTLQLPPYTRLTRLILAGPREAQIREQAHRLADGIRESLAAAGLDQADILGPQPCALLRLRSRYRYDLLLRASTAATMRTCLDHLRTENMLKARVPSFVIDVDPISLA
jgi:primosomal protein N' (replication factor Y)